MKIYDLIGVGFGPLNLALAAVIAEHQPTHLLQALFLDNKKSFSWHKDMLLEGSDMQISFLKDLAMLRNPSSPFTFLNYLHQAGRLDAFTNIGSFYPSRIEFNDYLTWVANQLTYYVNYSTEVVDILPYGKSPHALLEIVVQHKSVQHSFITKNVVIAAGGTPNLPENIIMHADNQRIWHSSQHLSKIQPYKVNTKISHRFAVIGSGQSAAEIILDLYNTFPNATIYNIQRKFGFKPADNSEFINELFSPKVVDEFYTHPNDLKHQLLSNHADTNYAVVDRDLISKLYNIKYNGLVTGIQRLHYITLADITCITESTDNVNVQVRHKRNNRDENIEVDATILATGYEKNSRPTILNNLNKFIAADDQGNEVTRYHQLITKPSLQAGVFLQGYNEKTHGIADTLLSLSATRAQEIFNRILKTDSKRKQANAGF